MGNMLNVYITDYDIDEVISYTGEKFNREEVLSLYHRFRQLDKGHKGYLSREELLNTVPELSLNPLATRLAWCFENVNFKEFVKLLAAFSSVADKEDKLRFIYMIFDVDGDGLVSREDLEHMVRVLCGTSLSEEEVNAVLDQTLQNDTKISFDRFQKVFSKPIEMTVEIPAID
mmetsp:Transcript_42136/g.51162  ORF Transcript_42136/g.51162 Transcript_42136/m.51162 type:complete len:173 (+) Transcript_42136:211-729(+)|eukprot:CAMPEP_0197850660 /NCGR_PEP_ID=MMETSP1438-20131217/16022_1 /TAXON_ID=1461541 /ORGANISM="Pterosperma sp., Strain CCMP1384" /LENGTH=172 /DNA_ID=CAMNT_0043463945 /DNA_START=207 /DNA_END=725 /DNA_ORIENTATION=+